MAFRQVLVVSGCLALGRLGLAAISNGIETRGDANNDMQVNGSDPIFINSWLFSGGPAPSCIDAADANDDGQVNMSDSVYLNNFLFMGGPAPPPPYPSCGTDPTSDSLTCVDSACS